MFLGINSINHDASVALIEPCVSSHHKILFAGHAERYSRVKNDEHINRELLNDCFKYGSPTKIFWYEKPWLKATRKWYSGQTPYTYNLKEYLAQFNLDHLPIETVNHHEAHAAMGYYTSGFDNAHVLVVDAIGEWNTTSIWKAKNGKLIRVLTQNYPHSMGLFYSAITQACDLKPNEEEYILMGMAAYGHPYHAEQLKKELFSVFKPPMIKLKENLHKGCKHYFENKNWNKYDIAASAQAVFEEFILKTTEWIAQDADNIKNLIIVGGAALNCVANGKIRDAGLFDNIWVPPNPGDAGLCIGAVAAKTQRHVEFDNAYLGYNIDKEFNLRGLMETLERGEITAIAHGRAEFGPRALGHRSLVADPRGSEIKDRVNEIKKRQKFRPFAPVILEEHANIYFANTKYNQEYMQWTNVCRFPEEFPAICHVDGTSRIQTVPKNNSFIRKVLEAFYSRTGCPMLLNTSLNIKGEPLVNSWQDAERFSKLHNVKVF